jgi:hypothetical protein
VDCEALEAGWLGELGVLRSRSVFSSSWLAKVRAGAKENPRKSTPRRGTPFTQEAQTPTMNKIALARPWWLLPLGDLNPFWWIGIAGLLFWLDYLTGPSSQFPVVYVIPVSLAAWYSGRWPALALAVAMPVVHVVFLVALGKQAGPLGTLLATTTIRGAVILVMALWFARLSEHERELHRHVQTLEGLLPICSFCKKIRNEAGEWERLETFFSKRSNAKFSHAYCPACMKTQYSDLDDADVSPG